MPSRHPINNIHYLMWCVRVCVCVCVFKKEQRRGSGGDKNWNGLIPLVHI